MNELKNSIIKNLPDIGNIVDYFKDHSAETDFQTAFNSHVCAKINLNILCKSRITPDIVRAVTKFYMIFSAKPVSAVLVLNKQLKIKDIVTVSTGYKAKMSDFALEISEICKERKSSRCVLIYNYKYKRGYFDEIRDIDALYNMLIEHKICLTDAVRYTDSVSENMIYPYNKKGYD